MSDFHFQNRHANVQGSHAWAETPGPLQTRSSKTSCNNLSTITKLNNKEPEEDTTKYYRKNSTISLPRISTRQGNWQQTEESENLNTTPPPLVPARHSTQRRLTHADMYVTQLARKFPRAQHTQLGETNHKTTNIHTPLIGITMNRRQQEFSPLKRSIIAYDIILSKWRKSKKPINKSISLSNSTI